MLIFWYKNEDGWQMKGKSRLFLFLAEESMFERNLFAKRDDCRGRWGGFLCNCLHSAPVLSCALKSHLKSYLLSHYSMAGRSSGTRKHGPRESKLVELLGLLHVLLGENCRLWTHTQILWTLTTFRLEGWGVILSQTMFLYTVGLAGGLDIAGW